jgi:hypothetical protein
MTPLQSLATRVEAAASGSKGDGLQQPERLGADRIRLLIELSGAI